MKKILSLILFLIFLNTFSQTKTKESWSFGAGLSHFSMHGDLRSFETGNSNNENSFINLGGYLYVDKMITPSFGFEGKLNYTKMSGTGQELSSPYVAIVSGIPLNQTRFEGNSFGGEISTIFNLSNMLTSSSSSKERKWNFSTLLGIGLHRYDSKLINLNTNEIIADYGNSPSKNGTTTSMYLTSGLALKYKVNANIDIELRQNMNLNNDDHIDAAVSDKQALDFFFKTNIGIVFKINDRKHNNYIWQNAKGNIDEARTKEIIAETLIDSDKDGVIDVLDKEKNTPIGALVYSNGIAIDSDKDGIQDYQDKCPLIFAKTDDGCKEKIKKEIKKEILKKDSKKNLNLPDFDKDGIPDNVDKCPNIYAKNRDGCPKRLRNDSDRDGILNKDDKCPLTFAQTKNGCPKASDSDGDGIADKNDKCPTVYSKNNDGCPKKQPLKVKKINKPKVSISKPSKITKILPKTKRNSLNSNKPTTKNTPIIVKPEILNNKTVVETISPEVKKLIKKTNQGNLSHGNNIMNNAVNVNAIDFSPIYPGCEKTTDEFSKKNCMINGISIFVNTNYNISNAKKINDKIRVLFIVDENGNTKVAKIIGPTETNRKTELKRTLESLPKMTPGKLSNKNVPVKYSLQFDLE